MTMILGTSLTHRATMMIHILAGPTPTQCGVNRLRSSSLVLRGVSKLRFCSSRSLATEYIGPGANEELLLQEEAHFP